MTDLKSMTLEEITAALRAMGEPSFRGKQVFTWLHRGITDFDEMMNIPKSLREKLRAEYYITVPTVARKQVSKLDGTIKYLWELQDGNCIETVLMSYHHGNTVWHFLAGRLPHGLQILRVHAGRQGEGLNTVGNAPIRCFSRSLTPDAKFPTSS